jgi:hypothetical protein
MVERIKLSRDLSGELKHRLSALQERIENARSVLKEAEEERELVGKLLELELRRSGKTGNSRKRRPLKELVNAKLLHGPTNRAAITKAAENEGHEAPARGVNAILMGYHRTGYVVRTGDEGYGLTAKGKEALSGEAEGTQ